MSLTIVLDTGPLGVITNPKKPSVTTDALRQALILWARASVYDYTARYAAVDPSLSIRTPDSASTAIANAQTAQRSPF